MEDLSNIWNDEDELNEEQLLNYIKGNSTDEDQHTVEAKMNNSSLLNDGVEGLQQFSSTEKMNGYVEQINMHLRHQLKNKKDKKRLYKPEISWQVIAVVIIIVLCLIGYTIIEMMRK